MTQNHGISFRFASYSSLSLVHYSSPRRSLAKIINVHRRYLFFLLLLFATVLKWFVKWFKTLFIVLVNFTLARTPVKLKTSTYTPRRQKELISHRIAKSAPRELPTVVIQILPRVTT